MQTVDRIEGGTTTLKPALTPEKLREFPGLSDLNEEEANEIIKDLTAFSQILFNLRPIF